MTIAKIVKDEDVIAAAELDDTVAPVLDVIARNAYRDVVFLVLLRSARR